MIYSYPANFSPKQLPPAPLPFERTVDNGCAVGSTPTSRKQKFGRDSSKDPQYIIKLNEISERARERSEQRRLKRLAVHSTQATTSNPCEVESPGTTGALKPHPPPCTPIKVSNQPHLPTKLVPCQPQPNLCHQLNSHSPLTTPLAPHQIPPTHESSTPYSESRRELQRQFEASQRPHHMGPREFVEMDASPGRLGQFSDPTFRAPGFRLHADKLLHRVSAYRVQRDGRGSVADFGRAKKVRFAPVVECFEF